MGDDPERKEINGVWMISFADNFRSHVAGCSTGIFGVIWLDLSWDAEVSNSEVSLIIEDQVFRLEVAVNGASAVHVLQGENDAS